MANFYLIAFDSDKVDSTTLHKVVKDAGFISWWHYIGSTYLIKTNKNLESVHKILLSKWPKNRYLIIKVDARYRNGWLPSDAWEWFKQKVD